MAIPNSLAHPGARAVYDARLVAGSLLIPESRKIARLLLENPSADDWHRALVIDNILQKKTPATAKRQARLIKARLETVKPDLWRLVISGSYETTVQALLGAAVKQSSLLGDFMHEVVRASFRKFDRKLSLKVWYEFLEICEHRDSGVATWAESTRRKLAQVIFRILAEARYVDSTRSLTLVPVSIAPEIREYLVENKEGYVLRAMEACQ